MKALSQYWEAMPLQATLDSRARLRTALDDALCSGQLAAAVEKVGSAGPQSPTDANATKVVAEPSTAKVAESRCDASPVRTQWIEDAFASHAAREQGLAQEISAVREATAVGASALLELRTEVQSQINALIKQATRLEAEVDATKLELAEVVIDKENSEANLRSEIEAEILRTRSHFHEMHITVREALEQQFLEAKEAAEKEFSELRQLVADNSIRANTMREQDQIARDAVTQRLEDRLEAGKEETMSYFHKIDKVMHHELSGVMQKLDRSEETCRRWTEEVRRSTEDECSGYARKFQQLHDQLEPRVFHVEEAQRHAQARAEQIQDQVRSLLASRYSSPADESREAAVASPEDLGATNLSRNSACTATSLAIPAQAPEGADDTWRFSHTGSEPGTRTFERTQTISVASLPLAAVGADRRASGGSSNSRTRDAPVRDGPSRASAPHATSLQPSQAAAAAAFRAAAGPALGSTRSPARASAPTIRP